MTAVQDARPIERVTTWQRTYQRGLLITDFAAIALSTFIAQWLRWGQDGPRLWIARDPWWSAQTNYTAISVSISLLWMGALGFVDARDHRITGTGRTEFKRVGDATVWTFGIIAIVSLLFRTEIARGYILIAFPLGLAALWLSRWVWRKWLHAERRQGRRLHQAVIVGQYDKVAHVASQITRESYTGYEVVGAVTDGETPDDASGLGSVVDLAGGTSTITQLVDSTHADTLIMTSSTGISPSELRELGWEMDDRGVALVVAPALTDIAGPRIHSRQVSGLPLIHIDYPELEGQRYWLKRSFDVVVSFILLLLLSPLLLLVALAVKATSPGPVFFRQCRIGQNGTPFTMWKFRSMVTDADAQLQSLLAEQGTSDTPLFKVHNDPRITPVGRFIRRYSLDELPQLFNALNGTMSLIGPRPQVEGEVALYDRAAYRRLLVKPGLTGLWQVSGRSNLSWDDAIRLDLYYVENWSMIGDLVILGRTLRAVLQHEGAH